MKTVTPADPAVRAAPAADVDIDQIDSRPVVSLLLAGLLGFALLPVGDNGAPELVPLIGSIAFAVAAFAAAMLIRGTPGRSWAACSPAFLYLPSVALLRAAEGGASSGYGTLVVVPLLWVALYGSRTQLWAIVLGIGALFIVPTLLVGGEAYPDSEWRRAALWVSVSLLAGVAIQQLIQQLELQRRRLAELTRSDPLTGLANRRALAEHAVVEFARARRDGAGMALAVLDLDHFKRFNDTHGHAAGDDLLVAAGDAWRRCIRITDLLARVGGEEFVVVLPIDPAGQWRVVVDRIAGSVPHGQTCSIGVATWDGEEDLATLQDRADRALYEAKAAGRDQIRLAGDPD